MALGFDELVTHLLDEIALSGTQGFGFKEFESAVRQFYAEHKTDSVTTGPSTTADSSLFSDHPPEAPTVIDNALLNQAWQWLSEHEDTHLENRKATGNDTNPSTVPGISIPPRARIYATENRAWQAITGHGIDHQRVPPLEFELLSVIASKRSAGILQPELVAISGQDKRSVPKRTDKLAKNGYITKEPTLANRSNTSHITLKKFIADSSGDSQFIFYNAWFDEVMRMLKEQDNHVIAYQDIRIGLGIEGKKWQTANLHRCIRRLTESGCIEKLTATEVVDDAERGPNHCREVRCLRLVREPTYLDRVRFKRGPTDRDYSTAASMLEEDWEADAADPVLDAEDRLPSDTNATAQWDPKRPYPNLLYNLVQAAGPDGITTSELQSKAFGPLYKRPMDDMISKMSNAWNSSQPAHLRHLSIIRDTTMRGRNTHYLYRTYENFQIAVDRGLAAWEAVQPTQQKKKKKGRPSLTADQIDGWGFPLLPAKDFFNKDEDASLAEIAAGIGKPSKTKATPKQTPIPPSKKVKTPSNPPEPRPLPPPSLPKSTVIPEKDVQDFKVWARKTADVFTRVRSGDDKGSSDRRAALEKALIKRERPGVYINPPGARILRFGSTSNRGRPRKACIAVFKLPGLRELRWFSDAGLSTSQSGAPSHVPWRPDVAPAGSSFAQPVPTEKPYRYTPAPARPVDSSKAALIATSTNAITDNDNASKKRKRSSKFDIDETNAPKRRAGLLSLSEESGFSAFVRSVGRMHMPTNIDLATLPGPDVTTPPPESIASAAKSLLAPANNDKTMADAMSVTPDRDGSAPSRTPIAPTPSFGLAIVRPYAQNTALSTPQPAPSMATQDVESEPMEIDTLPTVRPPVGAGSSALESEPVAVETTPVEDLSHFEHTDAQSAESAEAGGTPEPAILPFASIPLEVIEAPPIVRTTTKKVTGMTTLKRDQLILETIRKCGGVYPGDGEIWYPVSTAWAKIYNQSTDRHTISQAIDYLHATGQLKRVRFPFRTSDGREVKRQLMVLSEVDLASEQVQNLRQAMIASWPHPFLPIEAEITPELRRRMENHHLDSVKQKNAEPQTVVEKSTPKKAVSKAPAVEPKPTSQGLPHYKDNFPAAPGVVVKRTSAAQKVLRNINAQKVKSIYNDRTGLEVLSDGTIGRRYLPSQAAHSILHPDFLSNYVALRNGKTTLTTLKPSRANKVPKGPESRRRVPSEGAAVNASPRRSTVKRSFAEIAENDSDAASVSSESEKKKTRKSRGGRESAKPSTHEVSLLMVPRLVHHEASGTIGTVSSQTTNHGKRRKAGQTLVASNRVQTRDVFVQRRTSSTTKAAARRLSATPSGSQTPAAQTPVLQSARPELSLSWTPPVEDDQEFPASTSSLNVDGDTIVDERWRIFEQDPSRYSSFVEAPRQSTPLGTTPNVTALPGLGVSDDISRRIGEMNWEINDTDSSLFPRLSRFASDSRDPIGDGLVAAGPSGDYSLSNGMYNASMGLLGGHNAPSLMSNGFLRSFDPSAPSSSSRALSGDSTQSALAVPQPAKSARPLKRKYKSRKKPGVDTERSPAPDDNHEDEPARKWRKRKPQSSPFSEVDRLVTAVAVSKLLAGGLKGNIQWDVVVHCMSYRHEADLLKARWRHCREQREEEAEATMQLLQEPFLEAYEKGQLPEIDYQNINATDWPAILEWAESMVARNKGSGAQAIAPDLPATRDAFRTQLQILPTGKPGAVAKEQYFLSEVWPRKELAHNHLYGEPIHAHKVVSAENTVLNVAKTYCRAVTLTRSSLYDSEEAARKMQSLFSGKTIQKASRALVDTQYFAAEKKDRMLPGRNYHLHNFVPKTLKRWPGDEKAHLRMIAASRRSIVSEIQKHGEYKLTMHTFDPDMVVLTSMVAQGHLKVKVIPPARNDDPEAPFPKLTAWGYGDGDYFMRDVEPAKFRFPIVYEPTELFTAEHALKPTPVPLETDIRPGEPAARIPFWVDIHGNLIEDAWDMALRSLLFLIVYRPGSTAQNLSDAEKNVLGAWEIEIALKWMEEVGIAERCAGDSEGWKATGWWYCAFAHDVATWDITSGMSRW